MAAGVTIEVAEAPSQDDRAAILRGLVAFNDAAYGPSNIEPLAVLLRDEAGDVVGGLWGRTTYGWLYVELLFVPETLRGQGVGGLVIAEAEKVAHGRACVNAWVDCFGEANRRFYEGRGFAVFGSIPDQPPGSERFFLKKALRLNAPSA
ncbi:GNAT family N-acetyltransferase [Hansschlegelia zhihuaiae]|uniref:GNAT family N-acetyltransferase n=1 Tax=Hansschlegelia zhihuaiae TaxID=405005 RepID=A0A4Q0MJ55_9HYPH|nr:GNAT family N-acetyltransferase [Hansschlegelia zhihuaiae]RXF73465.1 GNAT family N-acetyltransferase [Hansschlegelia zhihuaiae]